MRVFSLRTSTTTKPREGRSSKSTSQPSRQQRPLTPSHTVPLHVEVKIHILNMVGSSSFFCLLCKKTYTFRSKYSSGHCNLEEMLRPDAADTSTTSSTVEQWTTEEPSSSHPPSLLPDPTEIDDVRYI